MPTLQIFQTRCAQVVMVLLVLLTSIADAPGQNSSQYDKGTPPQHAAGISSLGSYTSADLGNINLSNGALNIKLPLGSIGGRGFSLPLTLNYSSKVWSASRDGNWANETGNHPVAYAQYADIFNFMDITSPVAPGWTIGAAPTLIMRGEGINNNTTNICAGDFRFALTKLTVTLPDKGEIQLRDDVTNGAPLAAQVDPTMGDCTARDGNRGQRWHATDGSGVVFVSDTTNGIVRGDLNGVLILSDGTRYRFAGVTTVPPGSPPLNLMGGAKVLARATSITDRNGNLISITYPSANEVRYTDQLGRLTKVQRSAPDPDNPSITLALLITMPGYQGQNRYFKIKSVLMNQRYRPGINPTLPVINGDYDPLNWGLSWGTATRLFPHSHGSDAERIDVMTVMSELVLPDGRSLEFFYNEFGEVAEVRLPTGGKLQYDYQYVSTLPAGKSHVGEVQTSYVDSNVSEVDRAVVARRTYADGTTLDGSWTYSYTNTTTQVTALSPSGSVLLNQKHYFMPSGRYLNSPGGSGPIPDRGVEGTSYSLWSTGIESRSETLDAAGTTVIAANEQDWTQRASVAWSAYTTYAQEQPENDNRVNQSRKYLDNGLMAKVETDYDQYNNPIEVREYDFAQSLQRRTTTTYVTFNNGFNYATDDAIHMLSLPGTVTIFNSAGTQIAQTVNEYDVYTGDGNHASLSDYALVSQHDSTYGVTKTTRGNVTRVGQWLNTTNSFIYSYPRFDTLGNVVSTKDANGNVTTISFADDFGLGNNPGTPSQNPATPTYSLPTLITSPPPLPGAAVQTARSEYDYSTGLVTGFRDRNDVVSQTIYNDPFNRPTQVKSALGISGVETHTTTYYAPQTVFGLTLVRNDVLTVSDLNTPDDSSIRAWTVTDGFGRTIEAWSRDPQGDVKVITIYDGLGRVKQTSNPFRPSSETALYTTSVYDLAGRVTSVTTPDNAVVSTSYSANTVTVTDQAGKVRKSVTDALGRLIEVYEDPNGLNYQTSYLYDALDNLVKTTQGTQQRFFMYDSLKRLIRSRNPEQSTNASLALADPITGNSTWSVAYQYDASSNLTQKTDPRGVVSTYAYDAFNRNTTIDYSDTPAISPDVKQFYDGATNGNGRFWYFYKGGDFSTGSNVDSRAVDSYDALGRPLVQRQLFKVNGVWTPDTYQTTRTYNLAGGVTAQTFPSGHTVNYSYDSAGRTAGFTGNLGDGVLRTYASTFVYNSRNQITQELFGTQTPLYHKLQYNIRGQLWDVRVSTGADINGSWNRGCLQFFYESTLTQGSSGPDNNGNVLKSSHYIPLDDQASTWAIPHELYTYDSLNRLASVSDYYMSNTQALTQTSLQSYTYDRWGNRTINPASWGTGINTKQFTVDAATNRLGVPVGQTGSMSYDNAGNLTTDTYTGVGTRTYDADNRMLTATDNTGQTSRYTYDSDGNRVRRQIASSQEQWQIYGMDGELLAEYRASSPASAPEKEYGYRDGQLLITATGRFNVALAANGAVATASSAHTCCGFSTTGAINGNNRGPWGNGEGWNDATPDSVPDWIQVDFAGSKTIDEISVFSLHDNYTQENTPTETQTFTLYGLLAFDVQYWNGSSWTMIPGGSVTGNNKVWRKFTFSPITTNKIRVWINQVPDSWSRVVEIQAFGTSAGGEKVQWLVPDHLGTPRIILDQTGSLAGVKRHDYLPFGEELFAGIGGRTLAQGYAANDGVRQQFTQKERDVETGLDYFLARYYSSTQGRFTSPDEFTGGPDELFDFADDASNNPTFYADLTNPQSLNKYQYAYGNPLRFIDPDGHDPAAEPEPQDPKPVVVPLPTLPGMPPLVVPGGSTASTPTSKAPNDATIIEGTEKVLDTVCDYTGISALADWLRNKISPTPAPNPASAPSTTTPPQQNQQPLPPPPPSEVRGDNKLKPDPNAQGPHTTFKTDPKTGKVTGYTTWQPNPRNPSGFDPRKRVDVRPGGRAHRGVPTPHVQGKRIPNGVRPARKNELPK